jgi:hypothetical protein
MSYAPTITAGGDLLICNLEVSIRWFYIKATFSITTKGSQRVLYSWEDVYLPEEQGTAGALLCGSNNIYQDEDGGTL